MPCSGTPCARPATPTPTPGQRSDSPRCTGVAAPYPTTRHSRPRFPTDGRVKLHPGLTARQRATPTKQDAALGLSAQNPAPQPSPARYSDVKIRLHQVLRTTGGVGVRL